VLRCVISLDTVRKRRLMVRIPINIRMRFGCYGCYGCYGLRVSFDNVNKVLKYFVVILGVFYLGVKLNSV